MSPTLVILLVASCVAAACALIGSFLVLRRMALLGDAISHAVLPGIALAFLFTGDRSPLPMVIGAGVFGVLTVFLVELGTRTRRLQEDASIGVVFPALFAIGVILISRYAAQVDLDLDCVLHGEIAYTPWDLLHWGDHPIGPKALWVNGFVLFANLVFVAMFYKELKISTFDSALASALGFVPGLIHYLLMAMVSVTVVGAFESVGAILVVAMLVVPPATAYMLTERLSRMLVLSMALGLSSAWLGYGLARWLDASIAGAIATVAGLQFVIVFLGSPRHGLLARLWRHRKLRRSTSEQLLMLHLRDDHGTVATAEVASRFAWAPRRLGRVVAPLVERGWVDETADGLRLTPAGDTALTEAGRDILRHPLDVVEDAS